MNFKFDRTSFFSSSKSHSTTRETKQEQDFRAASVIQRWWKQLHLKQTALESFNYVHDLISLQQAQQDSFSQLEQFIVAPETLKTTHQLLIHLEHAKDVVLSSRTSLSTVHQSERLFLAAYMIVSQSPSLFETPTDIDNLLLSQAAAMLQSFEDLCAFMGKVYLKKDDLSIIPSLNNNPSFVERVFADLKNDHLFLTEGRNYLASFHDKQMAYYETFAAWESKNTYKLAHIVIAKYLEIEIQRFRALHSFDPRMLELYEGFGHQQETLAGRLRSLLGDEGMHLLDEELNKLQQTLEANKWTTSPNEVLIHELALDPQLKLSAETCAIKPTQDIDVVINALFQDRPNTDLLLELFGDVAATLAMFTPNNRQQAIKLHQDFSLEAMKSQIETRGLPEGLRGIISALLEQIQRLESPAHIQKTVFFLNHINVSCHNRRVSQ